MDKKLSYYIDNSNFATEQEVKKEKKIRKATNIQNSVVKIVNGEIVIDEGDMFINAHTTEDMEVVEDDKIVTAGTYGKKRCGGRWNKRETVCFYEALKLCGLDFTLISNLFSNKNRRSCKLKYLSELKKNKSKVEDTLKNADTFNRVAYENLKLRFTRL